jgi:hypothetical protein
LLQPKVETMIASAMIVAPAGPKMTPRAAVATRSSGACWMAASGSVHR